MYDAGTVAAAIAALVLAGFAIDYCRVRWWANPGGRLVMFTISALAVTCLLVVARNVLGEFPGHELVRVAVFATTAIAGAWTWRTHRRIRRVRGRANE